MIRPLYTVEETDHLWIEMSDGTRLAARLWRPKTDANVPALLEYIPYRKADMVRARDARNHPFFAMHGYACIRVDMRGSGDSEGHMPDMYAPAELDDARQVINWLAEQPWCNGQVGMFGTSWGGTAALQASIDAPKALKAVIAVCATHDRFEDDIHYMGGCVLTDTFEWGATLPAILASPPTPHVGVDWKDKWRARIDALSCPLENWLSENGRGAYWRHGSVIHQADQLSVPILAVGGWSDRYSNSVMTLVDARPDLVWGVVGPWGHHYPDHASPGPGIGFQRLALEWWDHYLTTEAQPGPIPWPRMRAWLREFDPPSDSLETRAGQWIEGEAPTKATEKMTLSFSDLTPEPAPWDVPNAPQTGVMSGDSGYFGRPGGLPLDQADDDARSRVFETDPLERDMVIYGMPVLDLRGSVTNGPQKVVARMSELSPEGGACRISYGVRNLALDDDLDLLADPPSDRQFNVSIPLHTTAFRVRKGHKLRIALGSSLWPLIWSSGFTGALDLSAATLTLPIMPEADYALRAPMPEVEDLPRQKTHQVLCAPPLKRWFENTDTSFEIGWHQPETRVEYPQTGTVFGYETRMVHKLDTSSMASEGVQVDHRVEYARPDGTAVITVALNACSQKNGVPQMEITLSAQWNGAEIGNRVWSIPGKAQT